MIDNPLIAFAAMPAVAYVIGSTPFGVIIARSHGVDLRRRGSGNVGATNVGRVLGARWGYLCFVLDVLKGAAPVLAAGLLLRDPAEAVPPAPTQLAWLLVACGAILGHVFSFWLKFRGGKGVATSLGVLMGFYPYFTWAGLAAFALWGVAVLIWRYVSLASILAAGAFPLLFVGACFLFGWPLRQACPLLAFASAMAVLVIIRHRTNITRLLAGNENRIGGKKMGRRDAEGAED
ncbi:MAG TPA: glycerol-3-phosphate 1-O-acyltransferase PlsY [Phycisphaerae bacterium]|nr:glycerol-3-phosphate 1-O-acyltransferase PlsY [Phycisphaerae bacterium]